MKKVLLLLTFTLCVGATTNAQTIPDPPEEVICRCKHGGCYGGNAISFRSRCGQSGEGENGEVILCSAFVDNCVPAQL